MLKGESNAFFQRPYFEVKKSNSEKKRQPRVEIRADEGDVTCLKLAKAGYGNPEQIGQMSAAWVLKMIQYEGFCQDYEEEYLNLNKNG